MLDFLDEPSTSLHCQQEGAYASYVLGAGDKPGEIILLDGVVHPVAIGAGKR